MKLEFKTGRLPLNFITLGYMLLAVGAWRIIVDDWKGILFLLVSVFLIFFKSGIIIDIDKKMLKKYNGLFLIKKGKWENIKQLTNLQIVKARETQTMSVLSISRTETNDTYKLYLYMPDKNIELMSGSKDDVLNKAKKIASSLHTSINNTE
ncbi:MAG: hypothetical protein K9I94_14805 [Bacteroidales bacterium]|nr:hypothetical protein [Bacteroidales bacterium]